MEERKRQRKQQQQLTSPMKSPADDPVRRQFHLEHHHCRCRRLSIYILSNHRHCAHVTCDSNSNIWNNWFFTRAAACDSHIHRAIEQRAITTTMATKTSKICVVVRYCFALRFTLIWFGMSNDNNNKSVYKSDDFGMQFGKPDLQTKKLPARIAPTDRIWRCRTAIGLCCVDIFFLLFLEISALTRTKQYPNLRPDQKWL